MSEENKNIDQLFSDAAHSESAPQYDSAYWAEMNAMLNARDKKKRGFIFWALGGSATFAMLFLSLFTLNMDVSLEKERYVREEINLNINNLNQSEINNAMIGENDLEQTQNSSSAAEKNISSIANNRGTTTNKTNNKSYIQNSNQIINPNSRTVKNQFKKEIFTGIYKRNELASIETKKSNGTDLGNNDRNKINTEGTITNKTTAEKLKVNDIKMSLPYEAAYNLDQVASEDITLSTFKLKAKPRYTIYAKMSGGLMEDYETSKPFESGLLNLSLNLEVNLNNVLLRSGIGTQLTSNADLIVSQRAKIYGFGVTNHQNDLSYRNLSDVYIPLEIGYQFRNSAFGVGAQINYLMTTSMDLNYIENNNLVKTEKYNGHTNGLNRVSTQGYIWFEQKITPLMALGLKVGTNISGRIKDDAYFNQSMTTNPIYGQISLRINITK